MIRLCSRPVIELDPHGGYHLVLWTGNAFDFATPFRAMLGDIGRLLEEKAPTLIELPAYEEGEDFVEGTLRFGNETFRTSFEHSLSFLELTSDKEEVLQELAGYLAPHIAIEEA